jgi:succinoglycan biosynthesis protein ExoO
MAQYPMNSGVDVSVIIPAWRAVGLVDQAVASALVSSDVRLEVVVVDDASADNTFDSLLRLAGSDSRVVVDRLSENSGPSVARNRAIDLAKGRYVAILDADDKIAPWRLASLVALADDTGADIAVDNMIEMDEAGRLLSAEPFLKSPAFANGREIDLATWALFNQPMKPGDCLGYLKPLIRRSKLDETGIRYDAALRNSEDYYLIAYLLAEGARMIYTPGAGYFYRRSTASTSHRLQPAHTRAWLEAEARFGARYAGKLGAETEAALDVRGRALRDVNQFVSTVDAMKERKLSEVAGLLVSDLHASAYTLRTLAKIAMGKALRRKLV